MRLLCREYIFRVRGGWCNLTNIFQGHRCTQLTACAKGYHHAGCKDKDCNAIRRLHRKAASRIIARVIADDRGDKATTMRRGREASRAIKNTEESEKEQKYGTITQRGVALLLEATDAMEMSDRRRRGSAWIVVIAVFHFACCPCLLRAHPASSRDPLSADKDSSPLNPPFFHRDHATCVMAVELSWFDVKCLV